MLHANTQFLVLHSIVGEQENAAETECDASISYIPPCCHIPFLIKADEWGVCAIRDVSVETIVVVDVVLYRVIL